LPLAPGSWHPVEQTQILGNNNSLLSMDKLYFGQYKNASSHSQIHSVPETLSEYTLSGMKGLTVSLIWIAVCYAAVAVS
jgi:hypothetical protein